MAYDENIYNENINDVDAVEEARELIIDGTPLSAFGVIVTREHAWDAPERDLDVYEVPGRSGNLVIDNNRFKNIQITYQCSIMQNARENIHDLFSFLYSDFGYRRIEDGWIPERYRMGRIVSPVTPQLIAGRGYDTAVFELVFDCKPQKYLTQSREIIPLPFLDEFPASGSGEYGLKWTHTDNLKDFKIQPYPDESAPWTDIDVRASGQRYTYEIDIPNAWGLPRSICPAPEFDIAEKITDDELKDLNYIAVHNDSETDGTEMEVRVNGAIVDADKRTGGWRGMILNETAFIGRPILIFNAGAFGRERANYKLSILHEDGTEETVNITDRIGGADNEIYIDTENYELYQHNEDATNRAPLSYSGVLPTLHPGKNYIFFTGLSNADGFTPSDADFRIVPNVWEV